MGQDLDGAYSDVHGFCVHTLRATAATNALTPALTWRS
jgi:hypothetical protein